MGEVEMGLAQEFKQFLLRGNVIDLAVAVVLGVAFAAVIASLVEDLLTPLIAAIFGQPDFSGLTFTLNGSVFRYGEFINALIAFITVAAALFFFVVKPVTPWYPAPAGNQPLTPPPRNAQSALAKSPLTPEGAPFALPQWRLLKPFRSRVSTVDGAQR
jgi:large conductance mechanosensitive channel